MDAVAGDAFEFTVLVLKTSITDGLPVTGRIEQGLR